MNFDPGNGDAASGNPPNEELRTRIQRSAINACRAVMQTYPEIGSQTMLPVLAAKMQSVAYCAATGSPPDISVSAEAKALHEAVRKIAVRTDSALVMIQATMQVFTNACASVVGVSPAPDTPTLDTPTRASVSSATLRNLCAMGHVDADTIADVVVRSLFALYTHANAGGVTVPAGTSDAAHTSVLHRRDVLANCVGECKRIVLGSRNYQCDSIRACLHPA